MSKWAWRVWLRLAWYIAESAWSSRESAVRPSSGHTAMPMLGRTVKGNAPIWNGAETTSKMVVASRVRAARPGGASQSRQANSSPPSRLTMSSERTAPASRDAMMRNS